MGFYPRTSLNPNADPFLHKAPFIQQTKLHFNPIPIPIYKTPPSHILAAPLHGYGGPNYVDPFLQHPPMYAGLFYDVFPSVPSSWPFSDGFCGDGGVSPSPPQAFVGKKGERKCNKTKKWVLQPQVHFRILDDTAPQLLPFQATTLMIKNIPYQLRRNHLLNILDEHCKWRNASCDEKNNSLDSRRRSEYDFVYLPMDFRKYWYDGKISNLGYAFVNFTNPTAASQFSKAFHRRQWDVIDNKKVCEIKRAKLQGLKALMEAFKNKIFWCHANNYLPIMLEPPSDGYRRYQATSVGKRIGRPPPNPIKKCV